MSAGVWKRGRAGRLVVVAIVMVALIALLARVDWQQTWSAIRAAAPGLLGLAAMVNLASLALKAVRWWLFLRVSGAPSLRLALRATFAGAALNNVLLANAGEAGRVLLVARSAGAPSEKVLATLALERLFEFAGYVVMFVIVTAVVRLPPTLSDLRPYAYVAAAVLLGGMIHLARHPERAAGGSATGGGAASRVAGFGRGFYGAVRSASTARRFAAAMTLSIVVWGLQIVTYHLTARAAHFDIPLAGTIAAILAVNVGFAVRATPGNVGVFQAIYAMTASAFGMDPDVAVGVGLLIQTQQILPVTLVGMIAAPEVTRFSAATPSGAARA